ncbi:MAG: sensor histidine kinase [Limisphaerales bacterium]
MGVNQGTMLTKRVALLSLFLAGTVLGQPDLAPRWRTYTTADGLSQPALRFVTIAEDGSILAVADGPEFCRMDGYEVKSWPVPPETGRVYQSPAGQLWTISPQGLWAMSGSNTWALYSVPDIAGAVALCPVRQNAVLCLLPDRLIVFSSDPPGARTESLHNVRQTKLNRFLGMTLGAEDELWITGENGVARVSGPTRAITAASEWQEFTPPASLRLEHFEKPEPDAHGVTMVAISSANGERIAAHFDGEQWETLAAEGTRILFAWRGPRNDYWAASSNALIQFHGNDISVNQNSPSLEYRDVAVDWRGTFWLATSAGLIRFTPSLWETTPPPPQTLVAPPAPAAKYFPPPGLAANVQVACSLMTHTGDIWLGGGFGTAWRHDRWTIFPASSADAPKNVSHFVELGNGQVWCASGDKIWSFDGKSWSAVRGGFNRITCLLCARDGSVWVASADGVSRFAQGNWVQNGMEEGLNTNAMEMLFEDSQGVLWAGARQCWQTYHPEADSDPPRTLIESTAGTKQNIPEDEAITLSFRGADKWRITPPQRLLYSHRLDEGEWSAFDSETNVTLGDLPSGKHYFKVRAMDRAGNVEAEPAHWEFAVVPPWYEESRLVLIAALGAGTAIFFAGLAYKRHRQLQLSYAQVEQQVAERTRELEMASRELLQSQKMRALGTLAAGIAHDFNNILSIIKGSAQLIEDNPGNTEKIRTRTNRIKTMVDQGSAVVQAMLGFSRSGDDILEPSELNPMVENTIRLLGDRFLREVEIRFDAAPDLPRARVSQSLVQQILLNFIFNAAESMEGRKRIVITTAPAAPWPAGMALPPGPAEGYIAVSVRDSGCGIAPENLHRVFEPFFTTKALSTRRGTGLGLSIAYELAKKMGAGLAVESAPGKRSLFSLILPVAAADKAMPVEAS